MWASLFGNKERSFFVCNRLQNYRIFGNIPTFWRNTRFANFFNFDMEHNIHFTEAKLSQLVLHRVGSKYNNEGVSVSKHALPLTDELTNVLQPYFLGSFRCEELFRFHHDSDLMMNEIYAYCSYIFDDVSQLYDQSINILNHLYEKSNHAKIQAGELYVAYFEDCILDDELVNGIGIFKTETKDKFLKLQINDAADSWALVCEEGTNLAQLDKGCLILDSQREGGMRVLTVDLKSSEAKYWVDDFLCLLQIQDDNFMTKNYLNLCKDFTKKVLAKEDKGEQLSFVNKSLDYFQNNEEFDYNEFKEEVFGEKPELAERFNEYQQEYQEKEGIETPEDWNFFISPNAVKKAKRSFRNIIQLDTQVEIKIQSTQAQDDGIVERGYDEERGMHFYKIYFNEEK